MARKRPIMILVLCLVVLLFGGIALLNIRKELLPLHPNRDIRVTTLLQGGTPEEIDRRINVPLGSALKSLPNLKSVKTEAEQGESTILLHFHVDTSPENMVPMIREILTETKPSLPAGISESKIQIVDESKEVFLSFTLPKTLPEKQRTELVTMLRANPSVREVREVGEEKPLLQIRILKDKVDALQAKIEEGIRSEGREKLRLLEERVKELGVSGGDLADELNSLKDGMTGLRGELTKKKLALLKAEILLIQNESQLQEKEQELQKNRLILNLLTNTLDKVKTEAEKGREGLAALEAKLAEEKAAIARQKEEIQKAEQGTLTPEEEMRLNVKKEVVAMREEMLPLMEQTIAYSKTLQSGAGNAIALLTKQAEDAKAGLDSAAALLKQAREAIEKGEKEVTNSQNSAQQGEDAIQKDNEDTEGDLGNTIREMKEEREKLMEEIALFRQKEKQRIEETNLSVRLSPERIRELLESGQTSLPLGYVEEDGQDILIRLKDPKEAIEAENPVLLYLNLPNLKEIRLLDIARKESGIDPSSMEVTDGKEDLSLIEIYRKREADPVKLSAELKKEIHTFAEKNHVKEEWILDRGGFTKRILENFQWMLSAVSIIILLCLLFLRRDPRNSFINFMVLPIGYLITTLVLYAIGESYNLMTLSAILTGSGMLLWVSVTIRNEGRELKVSLGAMAAILIALLPLLFWRGRLHRIFYSFVLTWTIMVVTGLLLGLYFLPAAQSILENRPLPKRALKIRKINPKGLQGGYEILLQDVLSHKISFLVVMFLLLLLFGSLVIPKGASYLPKMNTDSVSVDITAKDGSRIDRKAAKELLSRITGMKAVDRAVLLLPHEDKARVIWSDKEEEAKLFVHLKKGKRESSDEISRFIEDTSHDLPLNVSASGRLYAMDALGSSKLEVEIRGEKEGDLAKSFDSVLELMQNTEGLLHVRSDSLERRKELEVTIHRDKALEYGYTAGDLALILKQELQGEIANEESLYVDGEFPIVIRSGHMATSLKDLKERMLRVRNAAGETKEIPLGDLITLEEGESFGRIIRQNGRRSYSVSASPAPGYSLSSLDFTIRQKLQNLKLPEGVEIDFLGENQEFAEIMQEVILYVLLFLVLLYLLGVVLFQSLALPLLLLLSLPFSFGGAFLALYLRGGTIDVPAMLGLMLLSGFVLLGEFRLVDRWTREVDQGSDSKEALLLAAGAEFNNAIRSRVLALLGFLPLTIGILRSGKIMEGFAIALFGGILYSLLIDLFLMPILLDLAYNRREKTSEEKDRSYHRALRREEAKKARQLRKEEKRKIREEKREERRKKKLH